MTGPAIILVKPQLGENIGHAARAMLNFGLDELRLVAPRDGWPNAAAVAPAAGADALLEKAKVFATTSEAMADLELLYAATVRVRELSKPVRGPRAAAVELAGSGAAGVLFGPEASGLSNEDVARADAILTIPVNPQFGSLNLAQAVAITAYEWRKAAGQGEGRRNAADSSATKKELDLLYAHLEDELDKRKYFRPEERRQAMRLALRNLLGGAGFTSLQVRTLRGVISSLTRRPDDEN